MTKSKAISAYVDVKRILDAAVERGGLRISFPDAKSATHWRHRAYKYRTLALNEQEKLYTGIPGMTAATPYDNYVLRITKAEPAVIWIEPRRNMADITDLDGHPIDTTLDETTELEEAALAFAESLGIEL